MNKNLLHIDVQKYINENLSSDISRLLFKGASFNDVTTKEIVEQIEAKKKCKTKLSRWFKTENIYYPNKLNIEQTSSKLTAKYKSNLISGDRLIDLTGGFGVDCVFFSKKFKEVTHCEINDNLSEIVKHNFLQLNIDNIKTVSCDGIDFLTNDKKKYDWIYIDPSRRNDKKGKVFLLKDCLPNVPENLDALFNYSDQILIKNSPILDIQSTINELKFVNEIHIIAVKNEVKELLLLLKKNYTQEIKIKTINILKNNQQLFDLHYSKAQTSTYSQPLKYIYEPNSAILKSGGFHEVSNQLNLFKLHQHSHLYTSNELIEFPGRSFKLKQWIPYDKKRLKSLIPSKKANITTRNFPHPVDQIRKVTGIKDGGNQYLFFTTDNNEKRIILICEKINKTSLNG